MAQHAYTSSVTPPNGYVGYVNITISEHGVQFTVRGQGINPPSATHTIPEVEAIRLLRAALAELET